MKAILLLSILISVLFASCLDNEKDKEENSGIPLEVVQSDCLPVLEDESRAFAEEDSGGWSLDISAEGNTIIINHNYHSGNCAAIFKSEYTIDDSIIEVKEQELLATEYPAACSCPFNTRITIPEIGNGAYTINFNSYPLEGSEPWYTGSAEVVIE